MSESPTILIVDDSPIDRQIAGALVDALGLVAVFAEHGQQALEMMPSVSPDIILTDLKMPHVDGLELVEEIRRTSPATPVILMTAHGSEEIAARALRAGATSYVPKKQLKQHLADVLNMLLVSAAARHQHRAVRELFCSRESCFVIGYEPGAAAALVSHLQDGLANFEFGDEAELIRIGTALTEALTNAILHGNLELDSNMRDSFEDEYHQLGRQRAQEPPYRERRVHVIERLTPAEATYIVRDEGCGFDPASLPDPTDPENLLKPSGRGIMLIRTFMDEVQFAQQGTQITMVKRRVQRPSGRDE